MNGEKPGPCASPPCSMHELDPEYFGWPAEPAPEDIVGWRGQQRRRLIDARLALSPQVRSAHAERIAAHLRELLGPAQGLAIGLYWPLRGEPDLRGLLAELVAAGARAALPVVVARGEPLAYRSWMPGEPLEPGVWNIPVPRRGEALTPDVVIAPVVGFDAACYRLGYGGGYFDRTLAAFAHKPCVVGVGYSIAALATIHPQPHDIPMQLIVTEAGPRGYSDPRTA
jgi:5-formyltetrahydrofolate cyclo-ligase